MQLNTLQDLYVYQLLDLHSAEKQILRALPKMIKAANNRMLESALDRHREQTEVHVERLEQILKGLDQSPRGVRCKGMEGLLEEGSELLSEKGSPEVLDAGLIAAAQRVEHYEIAGYGAARSLAATLDQREAAHLLEATLNEEHEADRRLTELAVGLVNVEAAAV